MASLLFGVLGTAGCAEGPIVRDSLRYPSEEAMRAVWRPAMGEQYASLLERSERGIRLTDLTGDCWHESNSQTAVFLREPVFESGYYCQVEINDFVPQDRFAQAGLVLWADEDNYIRHTLGFLPCGVEALAEFNGRSRSKGVYRIYPRRHPQRCLLRFEVLSRSVRTYFSYDGQRWLCNGGFAVPGGRAPSEFFKGIGLLGAGDRMVQAPRFSRWEEGPLSLYQDDDFSGSSIGSHWMLGETNAGWGSDETKWYQRDGRLWIHPFSGADVYFYQESYPFAAMAAPRAASWEIEVKMTAFNPRAKGRWNKAGFLLWANNYHYLYLSAVSDVEEDQMYCEALACGAERAEPSVLPTGGFRERTTTDVFLRARKLSPGRFSFSASYDGQCWMSLGTFSIDLDEPQIRLFASGDISAQHPEDYDFTASFDYVKMQPLSCCPNSHEE